MYSFHAFSGEDLHYGNLKFVPLGIVFQEGFDEVFLKDALLERLKDDVPDVVLSALSALQVGDLRKP